MLNTFLSILAVVGIVAVSAFVIIFLCDLFISIVDGSNGIFFKRHKDEEEEDPSRPKLLKQPKEEEAQEEVKEEAQEEVKEEPAQEPVEEEKVEEKAEEPVVEEKAEPVKENVEEVIATVSEKTKEELAAEEKEQELVKANEELTRQIEELKAQIAELQNKEPETETVVEVAPESKEAIEARLEVLKQRLKENEKELSTNRKEFIPLRRVNMTLESDKKKLRRKEAIVAKRKVVLYGVNNYVDIDEEKAKELNEELELLEGLRLSVAHCEEVMEKNKDRYPILERANNFLTKNQEDLKADIAELEAKLKALEEAEPAEAPAAEGEEAPKADAE